MMKVEIRSFDVEIRSLMEGFFERLPDQNPVQFFSYLLKHYGKDFFGNSVADLARPVSGTDQLELDIQGEPITTDMGGYANERKPQRLIKSLKDKGYITVEVDRKDDSRTIRITGKYRHLDDAHTPTQIENKFAVGRSVVKESHLFLGHPMQQDS